MAWQSSGKEADNSETKYEWTDVGRGIAGQLNKSQGKRDIRVVCGTVVVWVEWVVRDCVWSLSSRASSFVLFGFWLWLCLCFPLFSCYDFMC